MKNGINIIVTSLVVFTSCTAIFRGVATPNQCKKCQVINEFNQEVAHVEEGCGSTNVRLEEKAKVKAYDLNQTAGTLTYYVECQSWIKEDTE